MKKLDILIPQYQETDNIIKPLLDSVAIQQNINCSDIGVIICNDGSKTFLTPKLLKSYPYEIQYYKEPHRGVSGTRNACLDHSTAEYVMFCDADDMFYTACGLYIVFREIENGGFDSLTSVFIEESRDPLTKKPVYINHEMDSTFVHGKIHRRQNPLLPPAADERPEDRRQEYSGKGNRLPYKGRYQRFRPGHRRGRDNNQKIITLTIFV